MAMETSTSRDNSSKKNNGKIPKGIHKAEREKMKRESLNELFLALANSLELPDQNNGKASLLIEATRTVKDMLDQIECLKKENATLLSESQYVSAEKSDLKDETIALEAEIGKLRTEISSKTKLQLDLNITPPENHDQEQVLQNADSPLVFPPTRNGLQGQIISPSHLATFGIEQLSSKHLSIVSKPHARYLSPTDKWPSQVLENQPDLGKGVHHGYGSSR